MEENTNLIAKPSFDGDITARIKTLGEITSNIEEVKNYAKSLNEYYKKIIFSEESISLAKEEKQKVNKFKTEVGKYRKDIMEQFNQPIKKFEELAKETESILKDTYDTINSQVASFENKQKEEKAKEIEEYFNEYKASHDLDFVTYEMAKINVTLSASVKSLKQQAKDYIDKILDDIQLINLEEHKDEILLEYKENGLNVSNAITKTKNRLAELERLRQIRKDEEKIKEEMSKNLANIEKATQPVKEEKTILQAPKIEQVEEPKTIGLAKLTFTVRGTIEQLKALKQYMIDKKIEIIK